MSQFDSLLASLNYNETTATIWRRFLWRPRRNVERGVHQLSDGPTLINHAKGLRGRRAEGFVDAAQL
jgi:hypothetical protein